MADDVPRYMVPRQAAAYVGLSRKTLARMRVTGDGPRYAKVRTVVIYDRHDLDEWLAERKRRFTAESVDE